MILSPFGPDKTPVIGLSIQYCFRAVSGRMKKAEKKN